MTCAPDTGLARLSYDQARYLLDAATATDGPGTGWDLHELRHSGLTHLGESGVPAAPSIPPTSRESRSAQPIRRLERQGRLPHIGPLDMRWIWLVPPALVVFLLLVLF
ncbi:hypothetical protein [Nocardia testacea]|uniref:Tyr recombinase domain-containing protein n=1 Tax=Nocardia testacea TaxID=248551 RepID=A0ABW7W6A5_9NOCA